MAAILQNHTGMERGEVANAVSLIFSINSDFLAGHAIMS